MKIALQYREQARRVYYGAVFEAKKKILAVTQTGKLLEERVARPRRAAFRKDNSPRPAVAYPPLLLDATC